MLALRRIHLSRAVSGTGYTGYTPSKGCIRDRGYRLYTLEGLYQGQGILVIHLEGLYQGQGIQDIHLRRAVSGTGYTGYTP